MAGWHCRGRIKFRARVLPATFGKLIPGRNFDWTPRPSFPGCAFPKWIAGFLIRVPAVQIWRIHKRVTGSAFKKAVIRSANASGSVVSHSHIVSTFHPAARSFFRFFRSRRWLFLSFGRQYSVRDLGMCESMQPRCWCQKQPRISIILFSRVKTRSGLPGRFAT